MKFRSLAVGLASVAVLTVAAVPTAEAAIIFAGQYTYLGDFTVPPGTPSTEIFARGQNGGGLALPVGLFDDYYIFNLAPEADGQLSANFLPIAGITGFTGGIYNASGFMCAAAGTVCTPGLIGTMIVESSTPGIFGGVQAELSAGQYAVRIQGNNTQAQGEYSGQVAFLALPVPEPAMMSLLGLGLLGAGLIRRRRK